MIESGIKCTGDGLSQCRTIINGQMNQTPAQASQHQLEPVCATKKLPFGESQDSLNRAEIKFSCDIMQPI